MNDEMIADRQPCQTCKGTKRVVCSSCNGTKASAYHGVDVCELCDGRGTTPCQICKGCGFEPPTSLDQVIAWHAKGHTDFRQAFFGPPEKEYKNLKLRDIKLHYVSLADYKLSGIDFSGSELSGVVFDRATVEHCTFNNAHLNFVHAHGTQFIESTFEKAHLAYADLTESELSRIHLREADLHQAKLIRAKLSNATLVKVDLHHAELTGAQLPHANLTDANLSYADLTNADLEGAELTRANLREATLERADLRDVTGIQLDSTYIANARFKPRAGDLWSTLRRQYTGPMFAFHFFVLACFMTPYVLRATYWVFVNRTQTIATEVARQVSGKLEVANAAPGGPSRDHTIELLLSAVKNFSPCFSPDCQSMPVWKLLLGLDQGYYAALPITLLLYNICRGILTWRVSLLRAEEERSGYSPTLKAYQWLKWPHRIFQALLVVAIGSMLWHLWSWSGLFVWLPRTAS